MNNLMNVLPMALEGWAGVFGVIIVLIVIITLMNKVTK